MIRARSAKFLFAASLLLFGALALFQALGLRHYMSVISLTWDPDTSRTRATIYAFLYFAAWMAGTVVAPPLLIAAVIVEAWERVRPSPRAA